MRILTLSRSTFLSKSILFVPVFSFLMVACANLRLPLLFTPVPVTLQTLAVYLAIAGLRRRAFFSQALYVALGVAGLSVFTNGGSGVLYLLGPTGGYILGFIIASIIVPFFLPEKLSFAGAISAFACAGAIIYVFGAIWFASFSGLGAVAVMNMAVLPFIVPEFIKISLAAIIASGARAR